MGREELRVGREKYCTVQGMSFDRSHPLVPTVIPNHPAASGPLSPSFTNQDPTPSWTVQALRMAWHGIRCNARIGEHSSSEVSKW